VFLSLHSLERPEVTSGKRPLSPTPTGGLAHRQGQEGPDNSSFIDLSRVGTGLSGRRIAAMDLQVSRLLRMPASSFTTIASVLAPTVFGANAGYVYAAKPVGAGLLAMAVCQSMKMTNLKASSPVSRRLHGSLFRMPASSFTTIASVLAPTVFGAAQRRFPHTRAKPTMVDSGKWCLTNPVEVRRNTAE
jgi:hypothetical protein